MSDNTHDELQVSEADPTAADQNGAPTPSDEQPVPVPTEHWWHNTDR